MNIRPAEEQDLGEILRIYAAGKRYMRAEGNLKQWAGSYPDETLLREDMRQHHLFVMEENGHLCGVFAFIIGTDPTYLHIENGAWKREAPYGTIHRICSDGTHGGIMRQCVEYCKACGLDLRVDTHADNRTMQRVIHENGFEDCGVIYIADGTPRNAYQYVSPRCCAPAL